VHPVDPDAGQIRQGREVGLRRQPLGLEAAHLAARRRRAIESLPADDGAHGGVAGEPFGIVDVLVTSEATVGRLSQETEQPVANCTQRLPAVFSKAARSTAQLNAGAQGEEMLRHGDALDAYVPLSANFVTQKTQAYCGVASMVIVLNAPGVPAPTSPEYAPYRTFTQDNLLDERAEAILPRAVLLKQGMTLDELGRLLALYPVEAEVHHAADSGLNAFRTAASEHLGEEGRASSSTT
jgi:hypothetical protein